MIIDLGLRAAGHLDAIGTGAPGHHYAPGHPDTGMRALTTGGGHVAPLGDPVIVIRVGERTLNPVGHPGSQARQKRGTGSGRDPPWTLRLIWADLVTQNSWRERTHALSVDTNSAPLPSMTHSVDSEEPLPPALSPATGADSATVPQIPEKPLLPPDLEREEDMAHFYEISADTNKKVHNESYRRFAKESIQLLDMSMVGVDRHKSSKQPKSCKSEQVVPGRTDDDDKEFLQWPVYRPMIGAVNTALALHQHGAKPRVTGKEWPPQPVENPWDQSFRPASASKAYKILEEFPNAGRLMLVPP